MHVPTLVTVLALPFLVMSRGEGGQDGTGMQCLTNRQNRRISVTQLQPSDCQAAIASAPSDQGEDASEGRQLSVTRDKHKHTLLKWKVNKKGDRVFAVSVVNESSNSSECYLVNTTSVKLGKKGKRKLIRCKYDRKVKDTKGRQLLLTVVPVNSSLDAVGGILSHKLSPRMSASPLSTTPAPTGCFNWRPHNISGAVTGNGTITVTWFPAFRDGGLRVSLYDKNTEQVVGDKQILSYETFLDEITSHTFEGVEKGNYEARIKPTGCNDCPERETEECHVNSVASDPIFASELTTPTPVGCYNWRPNIITPILVNRTLKVTWSPVFKKGSLDVYLFDKEEDKPVASHTYKSYEIYDQDITKHTFQNVTFGRYEVRIKPTGCKDCPDVETRGCHVNPVSSDPIRVFRPVQELTTPTPVGCYNWRPNIITPILVNRTLKVTWSPVFKKGSLDVYLFDKEEDKPVASHTYKSYEICDQDITKHTFQNVTFGRYEVRIKPTGCKDCPDVETRGCHVNPVSSDPIRVFRPVQELTTPTPVGCYNWRPNTITLIPVNRTLNVTWSPVFKKGSLEVYLYDKEEDKPVASHTYKSYEIYDQDITKHTFQNVTFGRYEVRIKPTGCKDCPDVETRGCHVNPVSSDPIRVFRPVQELTTPTPVGCYNWRPNTITLIPVNRTLNVTWSPVFKKGSLEVYLYDKEEDKPVASHTYKSYEIYDQDITKHTFQNVTFGRYEVRIKPTGCKDCPDVETRGCHVNPVSSDPIRVFRPVQELTTPTPVGCYNWRPNTITLIPVNRTLNVTWSPVFKKGSLEVYLYDKEEDKPVASHTYKSYEIYDQDITKHTFQNVTFGRYEVRIKPTGCKDCPDVETRGCHVNPVSSDPIRVFRPVQEPGFIYAVSPSSIEASIRDNSATFYFMIAVTILAVISAVAMAIMCIMKESMPCFTRKCHNVKQCKPSLPFDVVYTKLSTRETGRDDETLRIVILYGVDHDFHIQAVRAFAQLLRTLLNAEVVVEREQSRRDVVNIADWITTSLEPPTVVIVVASEGLYQLFSHHSGQQGECISTLQSDMFADFSSKALGYLREKSFTTTRSQIVLPVSFGYEHGDDSLNKLMESCRLLFKGVYFKVTESAYEGQRLLYLDELLQCLNMNQAIHVPHNMPEAQAFLGYVDAMNDHIRIFGSTCWKYDPSIRYYDEQTIYSRASSTGNHMNVGDTFSIGSGVSGTSKVTVNFTCRNCLASSLLTLPTSAVGSVSDTGVRSGRRYTISESSCVSEPVSESRDEADVFYSESEIGPETRDPIYDSRIESSPSTETSFIEPVHLEQTDIVGRDC